MGLFRGATFRLELSLEPLMGVLVLSPPFLVFAQQDGHTHSFCLLVDIVGVLEHVEQYTSLQEEFEQV